jgi:mannan endo-1,6-alpha-mannosidase
LSRSILIISGSIINAVNTVSDNAFAFYIGDQPGQIPGLLVDPYYWYLTFLNLSLCIKTNLFRWECGGFMGLMIQRWSITGNDSYNKIITQAIQHQVGGSADFAPANQSFDLVCLQFSQKKN